MLPDIRAVIAAIVAAAGLLMASFGLIATFRVAQEHHISSLQADLAKRGRSALPDAPTQRTVMIIDTPGPHLAPAKAAPSEASVAPAAEAATAVAASATPTTEPNPVDPIPVVQVETAPIAALAAAPPAEVPPPSDPPVGGPFAPPPVKPTVSAGNAVADAPTGKSDKIAAEKARKTRAARLARERKAAKRAAQIRRAKERSAPALGGSNQFGNNVNQLGGTFRQ